MATTYENIMFGPKARGFNKKEMRQRAEMLLERVGLRDFRDKYPTQLSGGMQRRAELARALINDPKIMILDEPFRGLDHMTRGLMQEYYSGLLEENPRTSLFITTDIDEAIFLADLRHGSRRQPRGRRRRPVGLRPHRLPHPFRLRHHLDPARRPGAAGMEAGGLRPVAFHYVRHPVRIRVGELVRIYLVNMTEFDPVNSLHTHANFFSEYRTGTSLTRNNLTDVTVLGQAERAILELTYKFPGTYMFHAHQTEFSELGWTGMFEVLP